MIGGELGMKIKRIQLEKYNDYCDIIFEDKDGGYFRICADKNIVHLLKDAITEFEKLDDTKASCNKKLI